MKAYEKFHLIFHSILWFVFTIAISLTCIYQFWCNTAEFAQLILNTSMLSGILGLLCFLPAIILCICVTVEKVNLKCSRMKLFSHWLLLLISIILWWIDICLFIAFTGGV